MGPVKKQPHPLLVEISHQVNSPLAAIRNALYLASRRTADPEVIQYLQIADDEVSSIANRIRDLRSEVEVCATGEGDLRTYAAGENLEQAA